MKKFWSGLVAAGFVATVGLSAQNTPPTAPPAAPGGAGAQRPAPSAQASADKTITVSGCIQNAPAASPSAGAPASASTSAKFMLASVKPAGAGAAKGGAVGTSGSAGSRYSLSGEEKTISPHLNHQVEITGTLESASASSSAAGGAAAAPTLKVESLKMVSATCS